MTNRDLVLLAHAIHQQALQQALLNFGGRHTISLGADPEGIILEANDPLEVRYDAYVQHYVQATWIVYRTTLADRAQVMAIVQRLGG